MNTAGKLAATLWEADRHVETLTEALAEWDKAPATDWQSLEADRDRVRLVDQLLFRFIKLQDAFGERLVPATLAMLDEPFEDWPCAIASTGWKSWVILSSTTGWPGAKFATGWPTNTPIDPSCASPRCWPQSKLRVP